MYILILSSMTLYVSVVTSHDHYQDYYTGQSNNQEMLNTLYDNTMNLSQTSFSSCNYCNDPYAIEPPPDDILFMPPPPLPPTMQALLLPNRDMSIESEAVKQSMDLECHFCHLFNGEATEARQTQAIYSRAGILIIVTILISLMSIIYFVRTRRGKLVASNIRATIFKSNTATSSSSNKSSSSSSQESSRLSHHPTDPCLMSINREKNLTSPIITDVPHKKTSIPSKYWAQPNSIIGNTISRMPNDYEVPSSRTNSTCTSSAVYADLTNEGHISAQARLFSPYNMHTYAEVMDYPTNDQLSTPGNTGMILPDSNYDNAVYSHGSSVGHNIINGSLQLSDFNPMRAPHAVMLNNSTIQANQMHIQHANNIKPFATMQQQHQSQPHRAQIIVTSNNQGCGPSLLHFKERHHDVI